ncbi:MAG: murein hydrolase activator EnvC family protein [Candidatus Cyclobacteriaceae bacterium M3_2C_046]
MIKNKNYLIFTLLFFLLSHAFVWAQKSRQQLEKEKKQNLQEIIEAEKILAETESKRISSIGQLNALNNQIKAREKLIRSYQAEIELLNAEINEINLIINALEQDLVNLKDEYASMVYLTYKANNGFNNITFLFSAKTFNQFFMRLKYMEQYAQARKNQVAEINNVKDMLQNQVASIEAKNEEKIALKAQQEQENQNLLTMKSKQNKLVKNLQSKESEIRKEIAQRKRAVDKLDEMITELVRREMEEAKRTRADARSLKDITSVTASFENNKSRLSWPVSSGFISAKFGLNPHPVFKGVMESNDGVNIQTNKDEVVTAVFDGVVSRVALAPPPFHQVVLVRHGEYFTVYSKLSDVFVKSGQEIRKGDQVGKVFTDKDGISEMHFMVWKNNQKLDPQNWLVKK